MLLSIIFFILLFLAGFLIFTVVGKQDFNTSALAINQAVKIIRAKNLDTSILYDLGSARGNFAIKLSKALPNLQIVGIDDSWARVLFSKVRSILLKKVTFKRNDIFKTSVAPAKIVYVYLPKELMPDLQTKLKKELNPGSWIITNRVTFPDWQPTEIFSIEEADEKRGGLGKIFLYAKI